MLDLNSLNWLNNNEPCKHSGRNKKVVACFCLLVGKQLSCAARVPKIVFCPKAIERVALHPREEWYCAT